MNAPATKLEWIDQYQALTGGVGLVEPLERTQIELAGADRASFLHNLCTNEIRKLAVGAGCEAFLTTVQGKTLAHLFVFACPETLVLDTVAGQGATIVNHLDHYLISEKVTLTDRSAEWGECLLAGPGSEALLARFGDAIAPARLAHAVVEIAGRRAFARRVDMTAAGGFLISAERDALPAIGSALLEAGATACGDAALQAARIECGFPLFGRDISDNNLPQEVGRDEWAISFVKGCYLGQETVARIDALGHVNKILRGVRFAGADVPGPGVELLSGGQNAGQVTSATYSPRLESQLALAYLRAAHQAPGTRLESSAAAAEVVALPIG